MFLGSRIGVSRAAGRSENAGRLHGRKHFISNLQRVIEIEFDPSKISYETLLHKFFDLHDPTTLNRQGPDVGTQYRSVIFYHSAAQQEKSEQIKSELDRGGKFKRPIVTQIQSAPIFYAAEEYHQKYLAKRGQTHCGI